MTTTTMGSGIAPALSSTTAPLQLSLQFVNGNHLRFVQTEPATAGAILGQMRPDRLFAAPHIVLLDSDAVGSDSVTIVPTGQVERLEIRSPQLPEWPYRPGVAEIAEISYDTFLQISERRPTGPPTETALTAELRSGALAHLRIRFHTPPEPATAEELTSDDATLFLAHLFTGPAIFGHTRDNRGRILLNPANVVRFTVAPTPTAVSGAWPMQMVTG